MFIHAAALRATTSTVVREAKNKKKEKETNKKSEAQAQSVVNLLLFVCTAQKCKRQSENNNKRWTLKNI